MCNDKKCKQVLIIENSEDMALLIRDALIDIEEIKVLGYSMDYQSTFEVLDNYDIDIITLEFDLDNREGLSILKELNENEKYKNIDILIITKCIDDYILENIRKYNVFDIVIKPFQPFFIESRVRKILENKINKTVELKIDNAIYATKDNSPLNKGFKVMNNNKEVLANKDIELLSKKDINSVIGEYDLTLTEEDIKKQKLEILKKIDSEKQVKIGEKKGVKSKKNTNSKNSPVKSTGTAIHSPGENREVTLIIDEKENEKGEIIDNERENIHLEKKEKLEVKENSNKDYKKNKKTYKNKKQNKNTYSNKKNAEIKKEKSIDLDNKKDTKTGEKKDVKSKKNTNSKNSPVKSTGTAIHSPGENREANLIKKNIDPKYKINLEEKESEKLKAQLDMIENELKKEEIERQRIISKNKYKDTKKNWSTDNKKQVKTVEKKDVKSEKNTNSKNSPVKSTGTAIHSPGENRKEKLTKEKQHINKQDKIESEKLKEQLKIIEAEIKEESKYKNKAEEKDKDNNKNTTFNLNYSKDKNEERERKRNLTKQDDIEKEIVMSEKENRNIKINKYEKKDTDLIEKIDIKTGEKKGVKSKKNTNSKNSPVKSTGTAVHSPGENRKEKLTEEKNLEFNLLENTVSITKKEEDLIDKENIENTEQINTGIDNSEKTINEEPAEINYDDIDFVLDIKENTIIEEEQEKQEEGLIFEFEEDIEEEQIEKKDIIEESNFKEKLLELHNSNLENKRLEETINRRNNNIKPQTIDELLGEDGLFEISINDEIKQSLKDKEEEKPETLFELERRFEKTRHNELIVKKKEEEKPKISIKPPRENLKANIQKKQPAVKKYDKPPILIDEPTKVNDFKEDKFISVNEKEPDNFVDRIVLKAEKFTWKVNKIFNKEK